ncbi:MAG: hypothetical protein AUF65_00855 [Chloroflexi bacterium 13_1_20CM_50_12]|nr:MAG: hypothetical protein AUF65_00855 [Chloroflexi bacterium 13_1_20CM_50_12]
MPYESIKHHQQSPITAREIEVLALLAIGLNNEQIAEKLGISEKTIDNLLASIKLKTRLTNRVLLAFYSYGKGYVSEAAIKSAMRAHREEKKP